MAAANLNQTVDPTVVVQDYLAKVGVPVRAEDISEAQAEEARQAAERALDDQHADFDYGMAHAMLAEAMAQQRTLEELRKIKR